MTEAFGKDAGGNGFEHPGHHKMPKKVHVIDELRKQGEVEWGVDLK